MKPIVLIVSLSLLFSCNTKNNNYKSISAEKELAILNNQPEGKKLMETYCYACHNPTAPETGGRIAPPMIAIKTHYLKNGVTKADFISEMTTFVENPTEDKVLLKGAFKRFGLMPKQAFPEGTIEKIASYMYDNQIEEPEWFQEHLNSRKNNNSKKSDKN